MKKISYYILAVIIITAACKPSNKINRVVGITKTASLTETRWALIELDAQAISFENKSYLVLSTKSMVVNGFGGCNQLAGSYESSGQKLKFNNIAATRMFCQETMQTETAFLQSLQQVNQYKIEGHELMLLQDDKVMARFRVVN